MKVNHLIIEPEQLEQQIKLGLTQDVCIVDLSSEQNYLAGHIPGAVFLPFQALLSGQAPAQGRIASKAQLENVFSYLGLTEHTHFIVYDDEGGGWAGRFIWTLDAIGHKNYSYINGGLQAWKQANFELETTENTRSKTEVKLSIDKHVVIEIPDIISALNENTIQIWDARSPEEYSGRVQTAAKAGHMPGAINCEWTNLMDCSNGLRIRPDARDVLANLGITGDKLIVTHCQSHHRSGFTYLVGKALNFEIKAYHGSWSEWGNHPSTPVVR